MSTSTDFEETIQDTRDAAAAHLAQPTVSTLLARTIAEDVGEDARTVGKAFLRLEERGEATVVNAGTPRRWTLVEGGDDDE